MGARFEYEGEEYVKTGPMIAAGKTGQRLIPKYAVLKVLGGVDPLPAGKGKTLERGEVLVAFAAFFDTCKAMIPASRQADLDAARSKFMQSLG